MYKVLLVYKLTFTYLCRGKILFIKNKNKNKK